MPQVKKPKGWWKLKELPKEVQAKRPEDWTDEDKELCARLIATSKTTARLRKEQGLIQQQRKMVYDRLQGRRDSQLERTMQSLDNMHEIRGWAVCLRELNDFPFFDT